MKLSKTVVDGMTFWYRPDDRYIGQRIALKKYEEYESILIMREVKKDDVVVDVGANIGYYTLLMASRAKKVFAIEPDKKCFEILKKNVEENQLKNVVLLNVAASNKREKKTLVRDSENMGNSRIGDEKGDVVLCERLDDILRFEHKIDLIKIDTQGWEPAVIEGSREIIKKYDPTIFMEYSPDEYGDEKMIEFLRSEYPAIWQIDYWFYISKRIGKKILVDKRTGYTDLWMKKKVGWTDYLNGYRNIQIKKVLKAIIKYGENKNNKSERNIG